MRRAGIDLARSRRSADAQSTGRGPQPAHTAENDRCRRDANESGSARAEPLKQEHPPVARRRHVQPRIIGEDRLLQQVQLPCRLQAE